VYDKKNTAVAEATLTNPGSTCTKWNLDGTSTDWSANFDGTTISNIAVGPGEVAIFEVGAAGPQPPVAEFSGNPTSGPPTLTVNFTDLSSGSPTSWDWTFGDGGSDTVQDPSHDYTAENLYTVSLTAYNAQGQDTETKVDYIDVSTGPVQSCHSAAVDLVGEYKSNGPPSGRGYYADATITVHDQDHQALAGVTVDIQWSGVVSGTDTGVTDGSGQVVFSSPVDPDGGTFTCCVTDLTLSGYPYQSGDDEETCDSVINP
jgi:PKD repeat protein